MKPLRTALLAATLPLTSPLTSDAETPAPAPIEAMGAYVPTDDMAGSETFYRTLFDSAPAIALPDFVAFAVAGGWFAIVSRDRYAPNATPGTGAVPYLQSSDLDALRARLTAADLAAPDILKEPGIHLLKITDPNGQLIEFFHLQGQ